MTPPEPDHAQVGEHVGKIPIREVSGLALRRAPLTVDVLAIGDHDFELAVGALENGAVKNFQVVGLADPMHAAGLELPKESQWEGIAIDGSGRIFVLEESPGHVFVFDAAFKHLLASIELHIHTHNPDFDELEKVWVKDLNSRGEGLVLLENGHLLVLKEKHPSRLIEFGPHHDAPVGFKPLGSTQDFVLPNKKFSRMVPLAVWKFSKDSAAHFPDLSELEVDHEGRLWVLSDEGRALGRVTGDGRHGHLGIMLVRNISDTPGIDHPEGLALIEPAVALVACDKPTHHTPLYSFKLENKAPQPPP